MNKKDDEIISYPTQFFQDIRQALSNVKHLSSIKVEAGKFGGFIIYGVPISRNDYFTCFTFDRGIDFNLEKFYQDIQDVLLLRTLYKETMHLKRRTLYEKVPNGKKSLFEESIPNKKYQELVNQCLTQKPNNQLQIHSLPQNAVIYKLADPPYSITKQSEHWYRLQALMNICKKWMINASSEEYKRKPWEIHKKCDKKCEITAFGQTNSPKIVIDLLHDDDDDNDDNDQIKKKRGRPTGGTGRKGRKKNDNEFQQVVKEEKEEAINEYSKYSIPQPKYNY